MALKTVRPHMITVNFPDLSGVVLVEVDFEPILGDDNDASYVLGDPNGLDYDAQLDPLPSYAAGDPINLRVRMSLESEDHTGSISQIFIFLQDGHPNDISGAYYVGQFTDGSYNAAASFSFPFDGTIHEVTWPLRVRPGSTVDDCVTVLQSGVAQLAFNSLRVQDADWLNKARVYEAWLEVGVPATQAPPCQLYPRDDDQGVGAAAIWPPPSSDRPGSYY